MKFILERASSWFKSYDGSEIDKKYNPRIEYFDEYFEMSDEEYHKELRNNYCVNQYIRGAFDYTQVRVKNKLKTYKIYKNEEKQVIIDINSLDELMEFNKEYGQIIIGKEEINPFITMPTIMIYDGSIE